MAADARHVRNSLGEGWDAGRQARQARGQVVFAKTCESVCVRPPTALLSIPTLMLFAFLILMLLHDVADAGEDENVWEIRRQASLAGHQATRPNSSMRARSSSSREGLPGLMHEVGSVSRHKPSGPR